MVSFAQISLILIMALLIVIICHYTARLNLFATDPVETMVNVSYNPNEPARWNRNKCNFLMNQTLSNVLANNGIENSDSQWTMHFPCGYDEIADEIEKMPAKDNGKYFIIDNIDNLTAKEWLWKNVLEHHGISKTLTMLPMTYVLYDDDDIKRFNNEYDKNKIYIMKKNIQRQEGLKITNNKDVILNAYKKDKYVLAQELLQDPYIIDGRKTNMRFYVLVVCQKGNIDVHVYNDGFMYYTRQHFRKGSIEPEYNITTGYIDRHVYEVNPLTHGDFRTYLDRDNRSKSKLEQNISAQGLKVSQIVFTRIYKLLSDIFISFVGKICNMKKLYGNVKFQLFGVDVAVNDQLYPFVMEINKGPDMGAKDTRDSNLKHSVTTDMMAIVGEVAENPDKPNGFIKILDVEGNDIKQY